MAVVRKAPEVAGLPRAIEDMFYEDEVSNPDGCDGDDGRFCPMFMAKTFEKWDSDYPLTRPCGPGQGCKQRLACCRAPARGVTERVWRWR